ncbi:alpha/beta fold hydrolase [Streptomyces sp. ODS28]|uniref:alpha/beta hydrolase family protein n=1 Tax=Streptomyces sp. ODS28 TaxID=3136688 RepID=UPI0031E7B7E7
MSDATLIDDLLKNTPVGHAFYTPPDPLPGRVPGDPIHLRRLDRAYAVPQVPEGLEIWLVLYRSESAGRDPDPVATSGIIVLPNRAERPVPDGGYPLVSWCHGTVGVANRVAPSRDDGGTGASPMNAYPRTLLARFLDEGWAVAMTDYEALGTGTADKLHPYMLGESEARAALDIVSAARRLFPDELSERFALVGHSQGGQAALFAAAHAPGRVEGLVAVAATAPANHPLEIVHAGADPVNILRSDGYAFTPLFLAGAIGGSLADRGTEEWIKVIDPEQVLSARGFELWPQVWERSRAELGDAEDSFGSLRGNEQFRRRNPVYPSYPAAPNDDQREFDRQLAKMNPDLSISVPVRIAQARADRRVRYEYEAPLELPGTKALIEELEAHEGNDITTRIYELDEVTNEEKPLEAHFTTLNADAGRLMGWLMDCGLDTA